MRYKRILLNIVLMSTLLFVAFFSSCKDETDLGSPDRLFRPILRDVSYGGTWIRAEWDKYDGVNEFIVQVSVDSFKTIAKDILTDTTIYTINELEYDTEYQLRIKAVGGMLESEYFINKNITTNDFPTQLMDIESDDVIDKKVRIQWSEVSYDSLVFSTSNETFKIVKLTGEQNELKNIIVTDLLPDTSYIVKAFVDGAYAGKKRFDTKKELIFIGDIKDYRGMPEAETYSILNQAFFDQLAIDYPAGVTIVLEGGNKYELGGAVLQSNISIVSGLSLLGKATIQVKGNFDILDVASINKLYFKNLSFIDHPDKPKDADSNFGGTYVFNLSKSGASVDSILFKGCDIHYKRGVIRIKTAATAKLISFDDCIVDSISGYGMVNFDNSGVINEDVIITNSTITHVKGGYIVRSSKPTVSPNSLKVENITCCDCPGSGKYFFDFGTKELPGGIIIKNSLFGTGYEGGAVAGLRSAASSVVLQNNYKTKDLVWSVNATTLEVNYPIDMNELSGNSDNVFSGRSMNDYSITEAKLIGSVGDPRWW